MTHEKGRGQLVISTTRTLRELRTSAVGKGPHGHIAYAEAADQVWVLNSGEQSITVLDGTSGAPASTIDVGGSPRHVVFDEGVGLGYVALENDRLAIVNLRSGAVEKTLRLPDGSQPTCVQPMFERSRLYALTYNGGTAIVDTRANALAGTLPTGRGSVWGQPHGNPCGKLYFANEAAGDVTVVDDRTDRVLATVPVDGRPVRNAIVRERNAIYTANLEGGTVTAIDIDANAVTATVPVGVRPFRLVGVEKKNGRDELWVLNLGSEAQPEGQIAVVSGTEHRVVQTITVCDRPANWLFKGAEGQVVSATERVMTLVDVKAGSVVGEVPLSHDPDPVSFSNMVFGKRDLFLVNADATVSIFGSVDG